MEKLVVTADVHGKYSTWLTLKEIIGEDDLLAVAGDLFGTRYPNYEDPDYQPDRIREELGSFGNELRFVYGNCDIVSYFPGYGDVLHFDFGSWKILMHHGHIFSRKIPPELLESGVNLVIQGHTHKFSLEESDNTVFLNPGSLSSPRTRYYTYAVVEENSISIVNLKNREEIRNLFRE